MRAKELIRQVEEAKTEKWKNSDLWSETQKGLEVIAEHLKTCKECRDAYDVLDYKDFFEIEKKLGRNPNIHNWICER